MNLNTLTQLNPEAFCDAQLNQYNYIFVDQTNAGRLYIKQGSPAVFVDTTLFCLNAKDYQYVDYTSYQNQQMHKYQGLYRFVYDTNASVEVAQNQFKQELEIFLGSEEHHSDNIKRFGSDRSETHSESTAPEYNFSALFEQVFGSKYLYALQAESKYIDSKGHLRYIDFMLSRHNSKCQGKNTQATNNIAIELNGERYHHPLITGIKQYRSQLFKQNSLIYDGYLVYRWSLRGMQDEYKFSDQMRNYFGDAKNFAASPNYLAQRAVAYQPMLHQEDAVDKINQQRQTGKNTFLVVLPTGTGKTEVFIQDLAAQIEQGECQNALAIVPSTALKDQLQTRLAQRLPNLSVGEAIHNKNLNVVVQTSAYLLRHYHTLTTNQFDYILVDEAHRAAAVGLRKVIEHFEPKTLLGLTATDERLDEQKLQDIFGSYQVDLTLEQAINKGLAPQIRAYRLESNLYLSKVRFNGKDFVKADLNKTILVPSRDQLIVNLLNKYFAEPLISGQNLKQGVIFCTDVKHAKRMAKLMNQHGISAQAVHGLDRKGLDAYQQGKIRFLCACDLLNEGWDAPQTEILVMARPTMSKVLYTQQLGRGTRKYQGKEALIVIDVVDSYGAALQPWSVHSLFNFTSYQPFANLVKTEFAAPAYEILALDHLWEGERRIEKINIFNFEKEFGDLLNEEQLARELFISTSTVKNWVKKGEVLPAKSHDFGKQKLHYFSQNQLSEIKHSKNIKERTDDTRRDDFFEFLEKRDYAFSYKIVFLLSFISECNAQGEVELTKLAVKYQNFYQQLHQKHGKAEKPNNPLNDLTRLNDTAYITRSLLANPFEKFERKRFVYHAKDLNIVAFDPVLWEKLTPECFERIKKQMEQDGKDYFGKFGVEFV